MEKLIDYRAPKEKLISLIILKIVPTKLEHITSINLTYL